MPSRRLGRQFLWALLAALALGFGLGWFARTWYEPTPESRARDRAREIQEKVRNLTH